MWLQRLLCVTAALNWLITLHILLIWHHLTIYCSPTWKTNKHLAGKQYIGPVMRSAVIEDLFEDQDECFIPRESKRCNTDGRSLWTAGETMLKNNPHLVKSQPLHHSQPMNLSAYTLVYHSSQNKWVSHTLRYCHTAPFNDSVWKTNTYVYWTFNPFSAGLQTYLDVDRRR